MISSNKSFVSYLEFLDTAIGFEKASAEFYDQLHSLDLGSKRCGCF